MSEPSADCVIVGGGIGGAVLALALGRRGHRVVVLERELHLPFAARPTEAVLSPLPRPNALAFGIPRRPRWSSLQKCRGAVATRPEVLARSTIEAFRRLGVSAELLREAALPLRRLELWRSGGGRMLELTENDFRRVGAQPYSTDPAKTRHILLNSPTNER